MMNLNKLRQSNNKKKKTREKKKNEIYINKSKQNSIKYYIYIKSNF
jgi:hypothetical protein